MEELLQDELIAVISDDALCATDRRRSRIVENSSSMKLVRCFKGVYNSQQEIPLMRALQEFLDIGLVKVEYLLCNQVKKERWNEQQVVAWLIASDVHLIIKYWVFVIETLEKIIFVIKHYFFLIWVSLCGLL